MATTPVMPKKTTASPVSDPAANTKLLGGMPPEKTEAQIDSVNSPKGKKK